MAEYRLYCFAQSGNAYKPALMLELADADWAPRFVDYFGGETSTPAYRAINVMAETPGKFGPADASERREILRWLLWDNHKLTSYTATYRFMRTFTKNANPVVLDVFRK